MINFDDFEDIQGEKPYLVQDWHPDKKYLAMRFHAPDADMAAVWDAETKQVVWSPEIIYSLAWLRQGTYIAAIQNERLDEESFTFALYSWPQRHLIQHCPLRFPMGYYFDLVLSPQEDFAICEWADQCEYGFEFIRLTDQDVTQMTSHSYMMKLADHDYMVSPTDHSADISTRPVFCPEGDIWVFCTQKDIPWWSRSELTEEGVSFQDGKCEIGALVVFRHTQKVGEIPLWMALPTEDISGTYDLVDAISDPVFLDTSHVIVHLLTGESQIHDISVFSKEIS
jgi:hypothetical protein